MPNKVAIVTGGAQGIGKEILREFRLLGELSFVPGSVAQEADIKKVLALAKKQYGRLDYLINNAGIMIRKSIEKLSLAEWQQVLTINLASIFLTAKYAAPSIGLLGSGVRYEGKSILREKTCLLN